VEALAPLPEYGQRRRVTVDREKAFSAVSIGQNGKPARLGSSLAKDITAVVDSGSDFSRIGPRRVRFRSHAVLPHADRVHAVDAETDAILDAEIQPRDAGDTKTGPETLDRTQFALSRIKERIPPFEVSRSELITDKGCFSTAPG